MHLYGASVNLWIPLGAVAAHAGDGHTRWKGTTQKGRTSFSLFVRSCSITTLPFHVLPFGEEMLTFLLTVQKIIFQHLTTYITIVVASRWNFANRPLKIKKIPSMASQPTKANSTWPCYWAQNPTKVGNHFSLENKKEVPWIPGSHRIVQGLLLKWT